MAPAINIALALAPVVPEILRWITGKDDSKAAEVAEQVVGVAEAVTGKFGMEAAEAVRANSELMVKFRTRVLEIDADMEQAYLADRQSARNRDVELARAGRPNYRADLLAFLSVTGLVACVWFVARDTSLEERAVNAIMFVAGTLAACVRDVFAYEFGSSRGSANKQAELQSLMDRLSKGRPG